MTSAFTPLRSRIYIWFAFVTNALVAMFVFMSGTQFAVLASIINIGCVVFLLYTAFRLERTYKQIHVSRALCALQGSANE